MNRDFSIRSHSCNQMESIKDLIISFIPGQPRKYLFDYTFKLHSKEKQKTKALAYLLPQAITFIVQFKGLRSWFLSALNACI